MTRTQAIFATLVAYNVLLVAIGLWAARRTRDDTDFYLGGRQLGPWVAAISASASSSSAWTLLGVSGAAYAWGISALWLFPATVMGFAINWMWVGPRLMRMSHADGSVTLTEFLVADAQGATRAAIVRLSSAAILFAFLFYIASQFQAAGNAFAAAFGLPVSVAIAAGAVVIVLYTLLGGFWAVSVTDLVQGLLMVVAAVTLPIAALAAVGGFGGLADGLRAAAGDHGMSITREYGGILGIAFVLGLFGIGLGYPGQPHVVNRFMAIRDGAALRRGRVISLVWAGLIYSGMILLGLSARVLFRTVPDGEQVFFHAAGELLPAAVAGMMIAAVLSAIMSTADSQLLVAGSAVTWDLRLARQTSAEVKAAPASASITTDRAVVLLISVAAVLLAVFAPASIFSRVLFAFNALGSAFGPALVVRLLGRRISPPATLASIALGFGLTVALYLLPDTPGDWAERLVPLAAAFVAAWMGSRRG